MHAAPASGMSHRILRPFAVALVALAVACGGSVEPKDGVPDGGAPRGTANGTPSGSNGSGTDAGPPACVGVPMCKPNFVEVPSCPTGGTCVAESACGKTIYCSDDAQCDGYPTCDPGHTK